MILCRTYGLAVYGAIFAAWTLRAAQYRGFVAHPEQIPYPWLGVVGTWTVIAAATLTLYAILRPRTLHYSWGRLGLAFLVAFACLALQAIVVPTDMPGYFYVPALFALVTTGVLSVLAIGLGASRLLSNAGPRPARATALRG